MRRIDNFLKFQELRKDFPFLTYDSFRYSFTEHSFDISFTFSLSDKYFFNPEIKIPLKKSITRPYDSLSPQALDNLVFHIGMIELVSYWKTACPPEVIIKPFLLSPKQVNFWKKIYFHGLGELFYLNSIQTSEKDFMEIRCPAETNIVPFDAGLTGKCLVPVGGGKDSAVTMGVLNENNTDWMPMVINPSKTTRAVIEAAGLSDNETFDLFRMIHPQLLQLNKAGFLNGHTPFSALLAFYSLLAAYLTGRGDIILSNESSANEATIPGTAINHQYSKTLEFEKDFRNYFKEFVSPDFNYFSLLRPLSEIQIARIFADMPQFHPHFRSCNIGSKTGSWCGECPKCLFTFIILSPFLKPEILTGIFGRNLLDEPSLENELNQLTGIEDIKPFECIGTIEEVNHAMDLAIEMYAPDSTPYLLRLYQKQRQGRLKTSPSKSWQELENDHCVPKMYISILERQL